MESQDGRYAYRPWNRDTGEGDQVPANQFDSNAEMLMTMALSSVTIPGKQLQQIVRPPLPQVELLRPRMGYRTRELGIGDIINIDQVYAQPPMSTTGQKPGAVGTARNAQDSGSW